MWRLKKYLSQKHFILTILFRRQQKKKSVYIYIYLFIVVYSYLLVIFLLLETDKSELLIKFERAPSMSMHPFQIGREFFLIRVRI